MTIETKGYIAKEGLVDEIKRGRKWRVMMPRYGNGQDYMPTAYECIGAYRTKREARARLREATGEAK